MSIVEFHKLFQVSPCSLCFSFYWVAFLYFKSLFLSDLSHQFDKHLYKILFPSCLSNIALKTNFLFTIVLFLFKFFSFRYFIFMFADVSTCRNSELAILCRKLIDLLQETVNPRGLFTLSLDLISELICKIMWYSEMSLVTL